MDKREEQFIESLRSLDAGAAFNPDATAAAVLAKVRHRRRRRSTWGAVAGATALALLAWRAAPSRGPAEPTAPPVVAKSSDPEREITQLRQEIALLKEQLALAEQAVLMTAQEARNRQMIACINENRYAECRLEALRRLAAK